MSFHCNAFEFVKKKKDEHEIVFKNNQKSEYMSYANFKNNFHFLDENTGRIPRW